MSRIIAIMYFLLAIVTATFYTAGMSAGAQGFDNAPKVKVELIANIEQIVAGQPFEVALRQKIAANWHTYWKNPGDSGEPTRISWEMPKGFTASEIAWPIPEAIPVEHLTNYGYSDQVFLPIVITPPADLSTKHVTLTANATWLVCEKICIPERAKLSITLPVAGDGQIPTVSRFAPIFDMARRNRPIPIGWPVMAQIGEDLKLRVEAPDFNTDKIARIHFFPSEWGIVDHAAPQIVQWYQGGFILKVKPGELARSQEKQDLQGILVVSEDIESGTTHNAFQLTTRIKKTEPGRNFDGLAITPIGAISQITIWHALLFAVLGGIILNAMPCVLPILSLKVLSLAQHANSGAQSRGLAYLAGVMVSFAILAVILILLKSLGASVGWGFQFQSPAFVLAMIALFFVLGLSMSGVFDIGGNIIGFGETLTRRSGHYGAFFTGMLATIAATPCTAPFMGAAVGYALTRSSFETFIVLLALGLGFAAPMVGLSFLAAERRILPRPGPWMETLKQALAFPLYVTVAWLVWVLSQQIGSDGVLAAGIVLVSIGLAAWIIGQFVIIGLRMRLGLSFSILICAVLLLPGLAKLSGPGDASPSNIVDRAGVDMRGAEPFSVKAVERYRRDGKAVFVNLTAAWCISCKVNERFALSSDGFKAALTEHNIAYLKGDWTNRNDEIAQVLRSFGRTGVPLYILYPADMRKNPLVLPQILTEAIVVRHFASLKDTASGL